MRINISINSIAHLLQMLHSKLVSDFLSSVVQMLMHGCPDNKWQQIVEEMMDKD